MGTECAALAAPLVSRLSAIECFLAITENQRCMLQMLEEFRQAGKDAKDIWHEAFHHEEMFHEDLSAVNHSIARLCLSKNAPTFVGNGGPLSGKETAHKCVEILTVITRFSETSAYQERKYTAVKVLRETTPKRKWVARALHDWCMFAGQLYSLYSSEFDVFMQGPLLQG